MSLYCGYCVRCPKQGRWQGNSAKKHGRSFKVLCDRAWHVLSVVQLMTMVSCLQVRISLSLALSLCRKLVASVDTLWDTKGIVNGEKKQQKECSAVLGWCIVSLVHISMMAHPPTISAVTTQMVWIVCLLKPCEKWVCWPCILVAVAHYFGGCSSWRHTLSFYATNKRLTASQQRQVPYEP